MQFTQQINRHNLIYLIKGSFGGRQAWHYLRVHQHKHALFLAHPKTGITELTDYGQVLHSGWGDTPPEAITRKMQNYNNLSFG